MNNKLRQRVLLGLAAGVSIATANAAQFEEEVLGSTILTHPGIQAKVHQFRASLYERISRGRNLPTLDVVYGRGHEQRESPLFTNPTGERRYQFDDARATLRQNLFDGLATTRDVQRLGHASMVRYYEALDLVEQVAFEASKAYLDVIRYRRLLNLAEDNYATHRVLYEKIKARANAGAGRRVDLETAAGRLALAESNLLIERANLHDVMARYQNIVGKMPAERIEAPVLAFLNDAMPNDQVTAINDSLTRSPQLKAALENIHAATRQRDFTQSGYMPRVDAYLEKRQGHDLNGYPGPTNVNTAGVTVTWNLFNGRADTNRQRQAAEDTNQAKDVREKVCREVRQNAAMVFNEFQRLGKQLPLLDQHQLSTDKAREAFRRQFDIGQRTLLDVLDTENEFYTAQRNYLNGETDYKVAQLRYLAVSGNLLARLRLAPAEMNAPFPAAPEGEAIPEMCPAETILPAAAAIVRPTNYVVLLNNPDGSTGKVIIRGSAGEQEVVQADTAVPLDGSMGPFAVSKEELQQDFGSAMAARPELPENFVLNFEKGKTLLAVGSEDTLRRMVDSISRHPVAEIEVIGHTDTLGDSKLNDILGLKRAQFIADKLRTRGVNIKSMKVESRGERDLLVPTPDNTPEQRNRRAEVRVR